MQWNDPSVRLGCGGIIALGLFAWALALFCAYAAGWL
jgi:hypothetical protein